MSTPVRVAGFLVALLAVFGIAFGVGNAIGAVGSGAAHEGAVHTGTGSREGAVPRAAETSGASVSDVPGGLMVSQDGYTLDLVRSREAPGRDVPVEFTITGPEGRPVTSYEIEQDERLHLIAVRRDFAGFQHVHPILAEGGTWTATLDLTAGAWRLFADFTTDARPLTLGADLQVPGDGDVAAGTDKENRTATVGDYVITLDGDLTPGTEAEVRATVTQDGRPVTDLEPYLGAYGHLVALREGDMAYLHVDPDGAPGDGTTQAGPTVVFRAAVPSTGDYRFYLDFKHDGAVRTAAFALTTRDTTEDGTPTEASDSDLSAD